MMPTTVAVEARSCFQGVDHEAVAGTGAQEGGFEGAGAARWGVGHLGGRWRVSLFE